MEFQFPAIRPLEQRVGPDEGTGTTIEAGQWTVCVNRSLLQKRRLGDPTTGILRIHNVHVRRDTHALASEIDTIVQVTDGCRAGTPQIVLRLPVRTYVCGSSRPSEPRAGRTGFYTHPEGD